MTSPTPRARAFLPAVLILFLLPLLAAAQPQTLQTDELVRQSEVIVVGSVHSLKSEWTADRSRIQTVVTLSVDDVLKGAAGEGTLTVVIPGGEVDGEGEWYSHSVRFKDSEDVVVFAKHDRNGVMRVTQGERGKFTVREGAKAGSKIIPNIGSLDGFTSQVRKTVKAQAAAPADR